MKITHKGIIYTTEALYPSHSFTKLIISKNHVGISRELLFLYKRIRHIALCLYEMQSFSRDR